VYQRCHANSHHEDAACLHPARRTSNVLASAAGAARRPFGKRAAAGATAAPLSSGFVAQRKQRRRGCAK